LTDARGVELRSLSMQTSRFFVVTGIDGAGKSSLLQRVRKLRPDWEVSSYQPADWLPHERLPHFDWEFERHPKEVVHQLAPRSRASFLLNMFFAHWDYWIAPRLAAGKVVVMDSYFYRFVAKERVLGRVPDFFYDAVSDLPGANVVLLASIAPEEAARRKTTFDTHEVFDESTEESFLAFQYAVLEHLEAICKESGSRVVSFDATASQEEVAAAVVHQIDEELEAL